MTEDDHDDDDDGRQKENLPSSSRLCFDDNNNNNRAVSHNVIDRAWKSYRSLVQKHRTSFELADAMIDRLLFWAPHQHNNDDPNHHARWREVVYGLLSLHRLAMDCACASQQQEEEDDDDDSPRLEHSFGTTTTTAAATIKNENGLPPQLLNATSIRIALTVLNCITPSLLELVPSSQSHKYKYDDASPPQQEQQQYDALLQRTRKQTTLRVYLERLKFVLRLVLLGNYWKQSLLLRDQQRRSQNGVTAATATAATTFPTIGLLQAGGLYHVEERRRGLSLREQEAITRRQEYTGRRTGRVVVVRGNNTTTTSSWSGGGGGVWARTIAAELLFAIRPLYWASAEATHFQVVMNNNNNNNNNSSSSLSLLKSWLLTLGMDLTSLGLIFHMRKDNNPLTREEWNRRRIKLFLYLLRSPIWNRLTHPSMEKLSLLVLRRIPLLGRLVEGYLWDWVAYWKHPFVSEQG
jgi:hypothetical protein